MNRQQKELVVKSLYNNFSHSQAMFLVGFRGMTVEQIQTLRSRLREKGGVFKVAKVRLMKRAIEDMQDVNMLMPFLKGQVGVVFVSDEPSHVAKVLHDFSKGNEALALVSGCLDSKLLDSATISRIATLPSREILLAQVCGTMKAPVSGLVTALNMLMLKLVFVLKQVNEKK